MKFRLSRQPKANLEQFDLKPICPSLRDDPAFSADPRSNPYFVTSHNNPWSSPPLGHPVLKNNKKHNALAPHANLEDQPPNFPNIPSSLSPQYPDPLTKYNKLGPIPLSSTAINQGPTSSAMSRRPSVLKKENKRMSLPSRRRSDSQPQLIKSFFSSMGKKAHHLSDLPAAPSDTSRISQPVPLTENLPTSASVPSQKVPGHRGRVQDLDQIDQLDETNPWGIRIHHDGPYEAANVQVNTHAGRVALGLASSNRLYNAHSYQTYIPPQVPTGVSLNLSPGQILSRNFLVPSIHPAHFPAGPLLMPPSERQYTATASDAPDSPVSVSEVRDDPPPILETSNNLSSIIGMAMLGLADDAPDLPDEQDFAPHDRVNQSEHCRVPLSLTSTQPEPRGQSSQSFQNANFTDISSNKLHVIRPTGHLRNDSNPPMYSEHIDDEVVGHQVLNERPSGKQSFQSAQNSLVSQNPELLAVVRPQQHSNDSDNGPPSNNSRNVSLLPPDRNIPPTPAVSRDQRAEITHAMHSTSLAQTYPYRDGLHYRDEPDVQSTNYSASSYSSGQFQNGGRPPPRHRPKHLVMPSPLNTGFPPNAGTSLHHGQIPRSQMSSSVNVEQTRFQSLRQPGSLQIAQIHHHGTTRAKDVPILGGRKLRKKMSVIVTPTPGPVVTTVSFAPPMFQQSDRKGIAQSKTDKPKRFLSKRKSRN